MKCKTVILGLDLATACLLQLHAEEPRQIERPPAATQDGVAVYFSPRGGCTDAIIAEIGQAKKTISIQAYSFTSVGIAKAILDAKTRGVEIMAVLDKSQRTENYSSATFLRNQEVPVFIDAKHAIAHNKIMLIDGRTIITGSFNFTKAAEESNAENLLIIHDKPDLYAAYEKNFQEHLGHSVKYEGRDKEGDGAARASPAIAAQPSGDDSDAIVYVTRRGQTYHTEDCRYVRKKTLLPMKLSEAMARGYQPCSHCDPPE